jgi:hypothetical protein
MSLYKFSNGDENNGMLAIQETKNKRAIENFNGSLPLPL